MSVKWSSGWNQWNVSTMKFWTKPVKYQHNEVLHETSEMSAQQSSAWNQWRICQHSEVLQETSEMSAQQSSAWNQWNVCTMKFCIKPVKWQNNKVLRETVNQWNVSTMKFCLHIALVCETIEPSCSARLTHKSVLTSAAAVLRHSTVLQNVDPQLSSSVL